MNGILLIDKPAGWTSFDVVAKVRGILKKSLKDSETSSDADKLKDISPTKKIKVGHAGTLDPLATGLMVILVGTYCKRANEFSKLDKVYEVSMKLGETSTTGDEEGVKTASIEQSEAKVESIQAAFERFTGEIMQVPPIYSAIKVNGQRAYKLARAGMEVKLEPRKVTIFSLELAKYNYPYVEFITKVSSGTYVRSLVEDLGKQLDNGAYMTNLRRTQIGDFNIEQSISTDALGIEQISDNIVLA